MCRLFETIKVMNGIPLHLAYHQERVDRTRNELFGYQDPLVLADIPVPDECLTGQFKLKVVYRQFFETIRFEPYVPRPVRSLKLVNSDTIRYGYKYEERSGLDALFQLREDSDDILIVKGGFVADTSYTNIAFRDNNGWVTPLNPLLKGTCRARLIAEGSLREADIRPGVIGRFRAAMLINAMLDPGEMRVDIGSIR